MSRFALLVLLTVLSALFSEAAANPFVYNYDRLRIGGIIFTVMLVIGAIVLLFYDKCGTKKKSDDAASRESEHISCITLALRSSHVAMAQILSLILITFFTLVLAEDQLPNYHRLRVGGLIMAAVLCLIGITILLSGHCRCKFNQDKRRRTGSNAATQQMLNDTARASEC
ncbi:hypothetical protein PDJAM_G00129930 [Pangasius djambal]|uniref:Uncharacterized protein n=1 Tax=Pangasius djambal TaxID=1691987 RepID=A0ACC5ZCZ4_9TELE|nr:hypothetical protein [Pangasius djambal]